MTRKSLDKTSKHIKKIILKDMEYKYLKGAEALYFSINNRPHNNKINYYHIVDMFKSFPFELDFAQKQVNKFILKYEHDLYIDYLTSIINETPFYDVREKRKLKPLMLRFDYEHLANLIHQIKPIASNEKRPKKESELENWINTNKFYDSLLKAHKECCHLDIISDNFLGDRIHNLQRYRKEYLKLNLALLKKYKLELPTYENLF